MPLDQDLEGVLQRCHVQLAVQLDGRGDVVRGVARLQLLQEPQPLLREGRHERALAGHRLQRGRQRPRLLQADGVDAGRQRRQRGRVEQRAHRQLHAEGAPDGGQQARGEQRVPTEREEVIVQSHRLHAQQPAPQPRQHLLRWRHGRDEAVLRTGQLRRRQLLAIHLAVGREGQCLQHHHGGRHHRLRQLAPRVLAERGLVQRLARLRDDVGHQPRVPWHVLARDHHRGRHTLVP
ncbi:hypothetical protein ASNO1_77580 [Corallococcus caeni]|uniref:Uncharacterized protein n=1 Tax=Corallococcus caeni TaxID=3082388 RepID=A0ABQ6R5V1_9BACT|nr:hypothetical protein ASNO1_77580 [Corallococcus sp. NO1]